MPKSTDGDDDYSYLSEFCHPNMMTFNQHYEWSDPSTIEFTESRVFGAFGAITASAIQSLLTMHELLGMAHEISVRKVLNKIVEEIAQAGGQP
jgi:hypothetical protein